VEESLTRESAPDIAEHRAEHREEVFDQLEGLSPSETARPRQYASANLSRLWRLWERRRLLAKVAGYALLASTVVVLLIPVKFESITSVMPSETQQSGGAAMLAALAGGSSLGSSSSSSAGSGLMGIAGDLLGSKSNGALITLLVHSRTIQSELVRRFHLQKVYHSRFEEDACKALGKLTTAAEDRKSGVITITVTVHDAHRARDLAQAYVDELNRLLAKVSTSSARRERIFIEQRLTQVKGDLENAEKQFSRFASKNTALDIQEQTKAMVDSAAVLQGQLIASQSELQSLQQIYTPSNVRVRSLQAQIEELQKQLQKMGGSDSPLGVEGALSPDDKQIYPPIRQLPLLGVEWADLYREMKVQQTVFELLTQQYEMARLQEAKEIPVVSVVDPASLPEKKSFPPRTVLVLALTSLSLLGGCFWLLGAENWQRVDREDPRKRLVQSVYGTVRRRARKIMSGLPIRRFKGPGLGDSDNGSI
jgi:capsule polysaccharide export protein KpsE/RkpR